MVSRCSACNGLELILLQVVPAEVKEKGSHSRDAGIHMIVLYEYTHLLALASSSRFLLWREEKDMESSSLTLPLACRDPAAVALVLPSSRGGAPD